MIAHRRTDGDEEDGMLRDERRGGGFARKTQVILGLLAVAMLSVAAYVAETRGSPMSLSALGSAVRGKAQHARTSKLGHAGNIALMLGGSTRAFVLPIVHNNLKKYVIDELEKRGAKVHTFMEVSLNDASSYRPGSFPPIIPSYFRKAIDVIKPISLQFHTTGKQTFEPGEPFGRTSCKGTHYALLTASKAVFSHNGRLMCAADKSGIKFQWYIKSRPDFVWHHPMPDDMAALMTGHGNPHKAILYDSSWQWQYNDAFYAVHDSLAHDLFTKGAGVLKDLPCRYTDNYRGGKQLSKELHDHTAGIDGVGPEALLLATTQWLGANPIGFRVGMSGCVTFPMAAALRCTHHYELDVKIASANASIALGKEMKEYTREIGAHRGELSQTIPGFGPRCDPLPEPPKLGES